MYCKTSHFNRGGANSLALSGYTYMYVKIWTEVVLAHYTCWPSQPKCVRSLPWPRCDSSPPGQWNTSKREDTALCQGCCQRGCRVYRQCLCRWLWQQECPCCRYQNWQDNVTLEKPDIRMDNLSHSLAVLGESVMVAYGYTDPTLVVYRQGSPTPVRMIPRPGGLQELTVVSTDCHSLKFLLTDNVTNCVFVIDTGSSTLSDCAVVTRQLWVGCYNGDIVIMSSQWSLLTER